MRLQLFEPNEWNANLAPPVAAAAAAAAQAVPQRPKTSRTPAGPKPVPEDSDEDNSVISVSTAPKPPFKSLWTKTGAFIAACELYPTLDGHLEAIRIQNAYRHLYDHDHLSMSARANLISQQLAPFPMLAINKNTNTAAVLHCITIFHPSLGSANWQHPAAGSIIAFMGNTMRYGYPPLSRNHPYQCF